MRTPVIFGAGLFLLSAAAFGQATPPFRCIVSAPVVPTVRSEGLTELVGDMLLNCTGGTPTPAGAAIPAGTVSVTLNTAVTSRLLSNQQSDALLMIDDPIGKDQRGCTQAGGCTTQGGTPGPNMFTGVQTGPNSLTWLGVPLDPPGSGQARQLRITNVRANANQLGYAGSPTPIVGTVSISPNSLIADLASPQQTLANTQPGLTLGTRPGSFQYCAGFNGNQPFSMNGGVVGPAISSLLFSENFPFAFKAPGSSGQTIPGQVYNSEGGFTPIATAGLDPNIGRADFGTVFSATLTNVPQGVTVVVPRQTNLMDGSGFVGGTVTIPSTVGFLSGANIVFEPDINGTAIIPFSISSRDSSKPGPLTLNLPISFIGAPATLPSHVQAAFGFSNSSLPQTTLFSPGSPLLNSIPVFGPLDSGVSNPPSVPARVMASIVPCTGQGASLNVVGIPAPAFQSVMPLAGLAGVNTSLIAPSTSNLSLVSTLLPAGKVTVIKDPSASWMNVALNQTTTPVTASLGVNPAAQGIYSTVLQFNSPGAGSVSVPVTYKVASGPWFTKYGFANQASYVSGVVAPGEPFVIFGGNAFGPNVLAPPALGSDGRAVSTLGNTQVLFDGLPAPLYYSVNNNGVGQVTGFAPFGLAGKTQTNVQVVYTGFSSPPVTLSVLDAVPGLYTSLATGGGQGSILNQDGRVNGPNNPESPGNMVVLYGGGAGQTSPPGRDGALAGVGASVATLKLPVKVFIDGVPATDISYSGPAPGIVEGVFQIDVRIPAGVRHNAQVPMLVQVGDKQTQPGVTLSTK